MNLDRVIAVRTNRTVYKDGEDCIKVFCQGYPKDEVLSEAFYRALAEKAGLPVPKLKEVTTVEGKWAIVSEYIAGKSMSRLISEQPERRSELLKELVRLQKEILGKDGALLPRLNDKLRGCLLRAELEATRKYGLLMKLLEMPYETHLCHGDICPSNVIVSDKGMYVIDWHNAASGSAFADAATVYLHFLLHRQNQCAEEYLELFAGGEADSVLGWVPIVAAASSAESNFQERERLLSLVNAVE